MHWHETLANSSAYERRRLEYLQDKYALEGFHWSFNGVPLVGDSKQYSQLEKTYDDGNRRLQDQHQTAKASVGVGKYVSFQGKEVLCVVYTS